MNRNLDYQTPNNFFEAEDARVHKFVGGSVHQTGEKMLHKFCNSSTLEEFEEEKCLLCIK